MRIEALLLAFMLVVMASSVMAAGEVNVDVTATGTTYTYPGDTTVASAEVNAGTIYEYNVSYSTKTGYWAGIYGKISGQYILGDGTSNMYTWNVTAPSGYILVSYTSAPNFAAVSAINSGTLATDQADLYNAIRTDLTTWAPDADQNVDKTFEYNADADCGYAGATLAAHIGGQWNGNSYWPVCAYKDDGNHVVYASPIDATGTAFDGNPTQYEAMVAADAAGTTVYFFKG